MALPNALLTITIVTVTACATGTNDSSSPGDGQPACGDGAGCPSPQVCGSAVCSGSELCMAGTCVAASDVARLTPSGSDVVGDNVNRSCTEDAPCRRVDHACAVGFHWARMSGNFRDPIIIDNGCRITVVGAPGATLTAAPGDVAITIADTSTSGAIYDLSVTGSTNHHTNAIEMPESRGDPEAALVNVKVLESGGVGVRAAGGSLRMKDCWITRSMDGGLVVIGATSFDVDGGEFSHNGSPTSTQGGIWIRANAMTGNRIQSVMVTNNQAITDPDTAPGIFCAAPGAVVRATVEHNGLTDATAQVAGSCEFHLNGSSP